MHWIEIGVTWSTTIIKNIPTNPDLVCKFSYFDKNLKTHESECREKFQDENIYRDISEYYMICDSVD